MKRLLILLLATPLLGGCMQTLKGSVAGSCAVFERPPYAVKGKTSYDQGVADNFIESGVAGCRWARPAARPASLDSQIYKTPRPSHVKKRGLLRRIKDRVAHPFTAPIAPVVESPPVADEPKLPPMIEPPAKPRDPVDELLHPSK